MTLFLKRLFCRHEKYECVKVIKRGEHDSICRFECDEACVDCGKFKKYLKD